jgi:hypothetical protein
MVDWRDLELKLNTLSVKDLKWVIDHCNSLIRAIEIGKSPTK